MSPPALELADIFRLHGPAYRQAHPLPWHQHRLMQDIETCRTPELGGSVEWCDHCQYTHIRYRSCRNRHCPKCQGAARGWGQNLHFHPHLHCVVPSGGLSADHDRWMQGRRRFLFPVKVLSHLFRRLFLEALEKAHTAGQLQFFGDLEPLRDPKAFARDLAPLRKSKWVVYAKAPFGGPQHVLEYLGRYTHRVAISNRRLLAAPCTDLLPQPADCHGLLVALTASHFRLCPCCGVGTLTSIQILWPCHGSASVRVDSS